MDLNDNRVSSSSSAFGASHFCLSDVSARDEHTPESISSLKVSVTEMIPCVPLFPLLVGALM